MKQPTEGGHYFYRTHDQYGGEIKDGMEAYAVMEFVSDEERWKWVFAPRLDQLLAEVNSLGWKYELYSHPEFGKYHCVIQKGGIRKLFSGNSPEEAAAAAVLWIYQQKAGDSAV